VGGSQEILTRKSKNGSSKTIFSLKGFVTPSLGYIRMELKVNKEEPLLNGIVSCPTDTEVVILGPRQRTNMLKLYFKQRQQIEVCSEQEALTDGQTSYISSSL
jgi:hypothetical protein